jgi:hypothetical protein
VANLVSEVALASACTLNTLSDNLHLYTANSGSCFDYPSSLGCLLMLLYLPPH